MFESQAYRVRFFPRAAAFILAALILPARSADAPAPGQSFATAAGDGAWTFFTDPRAVYFKGQQEKVYLGGGARAPGVR